ncbi:MAG: phosphoribosylanthranilate isomerase [Candidatus Eremiobacteraeota bacterium]|nr:phosphoribosylanthranilate isomerase [Candidatus Eremiobacteraeota bacterium]
MADVWTKLCGCTSWPDVALAIEAGADAFGMIFAPSPRRIEWSAAVEIARRLPAGILPVGVFVDPSREEVDAVLAHFPRALLQFSGAEAPAFVAPYGERAIKALHVDAPWDELERRATRFPRATLLLDSRRDGLAGGTGTTFPWDGAAPLAAHRRVVVAGGLTAENVAACVASTRAYGVDVRSGIETAGRKDPAKMRAFVRTAKEAG